MVSLIPLGHGSGVDESDAVEESWHTEVWTSERYRSRLGYDGRRLER